MSRSTSLDTPALRNGRVAATPNSATVAGRRGAARVDVARLTLWLVAGLTLRRYAAARPSTAWKAASRAWVTTAVFHSSVST